MIDESILDTTKKILSVDAEYDVFDLDIMTHINTYFSVLHQVGVGPKDGFAITGPLEVWGQFTNNYAVLNDVKSYIWAKVRLAFDPPTTGYTTTLIENLCKELEWRLQVTAEKIAPYDAGPTPPPPTPEPDPEEVDP